MGAIDTLEGAKWSLVGDEALSATGDSGRVVFRAVHTLRGLRHTLFLTPEEVVQFLNRDGLEALSQRK